MTQEIIRIAANDDAVLNVGLVTRCFQNEIIPRDTDTSSTVGTTINEESLSIDVRLIQVNTKTLTPIPKNNEYETNNKACSIEPTDLEGWK